MKEVMVVLLSITMAKFQVRESMGSLQGMAAAVTFISITMAKFQVRESMGSLQNMSATVEGFILITVGQFQM